MYLVHVLSWLVRFVTIVLLLASASRDAVGQITGLTVPTVGEPYTARLLKIDSNWDVTLDDDGNERMIAASDLVRWGSYRDDDTASRVALRDGSILVGDVMEIDDTTITIESAACPATKVVRSFVASVVFSPPAMVHARDRLLQTTPLDKQTLDVVLLRNGDQLAGRLTAAPESVPPNDGFGVHGFGVALRPDTAPVALSVDDVMAVLLRTDDGEKPALPPTRITWLGFKDGSLLAVDAIDVHPPDVRLTLSCGQRVTLPVETMLRYLRLVQPLGTATRYLSDLTPLGFQHSPFLELERTLGRDRNVLGGQLRTDGHLQLKGLGMPASSRVIFEVTETDRRFAAELALDDAADDRGSVVFRVFLEKQENDQEVSWQTAYTSHVVRGGDVPLPISIDLAGTKKIALIVDFADHGDARDYANWLNARFHP